MTTTSLLGTCPVKSMRRPMFTGPPPFSLLLCNWPHHHMLYCLQNAEASDQQICLIGHIIWVWVYLLPPAAFQLGFRKKQADASVWPAISRLPSIVLEVGDSESLTQLKFDARLWFEHMLEVSQFLPLLPLTHWNFFRYSWSSFFSSTSPLPPTQIF